MNTVLRQDFAFAPSKANPNAVFLQLVFVYLLLQSFAFAFDSGIFKLLSGAFAFAVFGVAFVNAVFLAPMRSAIPAAPIGLAVILGFLLYYVGMTGNLTISRGGTDIQEWAKIFMTPAFLIFGFVFTGRDARPAWDSQINRVMFWTLVLLPVAVWGSQLATGRTAIGGGNIVGTFVNRNNAALYYLVLLAYYGNLTGRPVKHLAPYLFVGVAFGTLGVLLATLIAIFVAVGKKQYIPRLIVASLVGVVAVFLLPEELVLARLTRVVDSYRLLAEGRIDLRAVTYGELVTQLRTTDLSFIFRLKHWVDLLAIFSGADWHQILFGFGVGSSARLSAAHFVPHNDYVRYLFECGVLALTGFLVLLTTSLKAIGRQWIAVPLLAVGIYFFSENLINNYLAMTLFYFCLGSALSQARQQEKLGGAV